MSIRKALGAVKDQTSISIAKVSSTVAPEVDVLVVKVTSHDDEPAEERHIREILALTDRSLPMVSACCYALSRRLHKTRDWVVAVKSLSLAHRLLTHGDLSFPRELIRSSRYSARPLSLPDFRDEAHSNSWDHSSFVRTYALYLDHLLDSPAGGRTDPSREMPTDRLLERTRDLQLLLDRFLACRPTGRAKSSRLVLVSLYPVVKESFSFYVGLSEALAALLDRFPDLEHADCVKALDAYASAAKQIDELLGFYGWCKEVGVARSSEYPEVVRIADTMLQSLEEFARGKAGGRPQSPESNHRAPAVAPAEEEPAEDMNSIKALPAPEDYVEKPPEVEREPANKPSHPPSAQPQQTADLVDLREDATTADAQGNKLALALFSTPGAGTVNNGTWEAFPSSADEPEVKSAWQTPAAESGKADWELALVEHASNLSKQQAELGGGFDRVLLEGMYDQGVVRHQVNAQMGGGSNSSVALPGPGRGAAPVLALPAPDGTVQTIGQDPFAASLTVPAPSYVQMAEIEKKQQLLIQEQQLWQQYSQSGMQGQLSLAKLSLAQNPVAMPLPYGMPPANGAYYYPQ